MRACDTAPEPNCPLAYHAFSVHWHHRSNYRGIVSALEEKTFHLLILAVSVAFVLVLQPLYGAIVWGSILAIVFAPLYRRMLRVMRQKPSLAAAVTVALVLVLVILPLIMVVALLVREVTGAYARIESGELDIVGFFRRMFDLLPAWMADLLERFGLTDFGAVWERSIATLLKGSQFVAAQAFVVGHNVLDFGVNLFVMLYLLFFLLRDGEELSARILNAIPLPADQKVALISRFTVVIRATVKGNILVAALQGALGGLIFWAMDIHAAVLWAVVMAFLSLLPAIGAALVWLPVAIYMVMSGDIWQGIALTAYGVLVIGLVDNFLRPVLVGKDTKLPDYVVLISTLGGLTFFGINGFVLGPVIAAMFMAVWTILGASRERAEEERSASGNR
jgi:predicted PurR-regulated permease PerM